MGRSSRASWSSRPSRPRRPRSSRRSRGSRPITGRRVERVARSELDRLSRGVRHQGAVAFAPELGVTPLHDVPLDDRALVVALDEIQDPQNFGAVIRSAVAMSASAVVWPEHRSAPLSPATFRASAGRHRARDPVPRRVPSAGARVAARARASSSWAWTPTVPPRSTASISIAPVAIVVGAEGKGLRKTVKRVCDTLVRLPMPGPIGSLNASVAVAIALYECVRQRGAR